MMKFYKIIWNMQQAADAFQKGDYTTSIKIYSDIIDKQ